MKKGTQSAALDVMDKVWQNASRNSYTTLNSTLHSILDGLIRLDFDFGINDLEEISKRYKAGFWFGASLNGHHKGEWLYRTGTQSYNNSFVLSYEKFFKREPFILNNKRVYEGFEYSDGSLWWTVTGWTADNKNIKAVGYVNRMKEGKKKLIEFNREKWLESRKQFYTL